jgi:PAS domain S-box-containing protein
MKQGPLLDEALARALVEAAPDALIVIDGRGCVVFINAQGEAMFGYAREELVGQPVEVLVPVRARRAHAAHRAAFAEQPAARPMGAGLELFGRRRDGAEFPVDVRLSPVTAGSVRFTAAAVRDVTEGRRVAHNLRDAEERFRVALDEAPIGMALTGLDGRLMRVNHALCRLLGYASEELTGLAFADITHPDDLDDDLAIARQLAQGQISRANFGKRYLCKDGRVVSAMLSVSLVRDRDDRPRYFITQVEDVTERQRAERDREESLGWLRAFLDQCPVAMVLLHGPSGERVETNGEAQRLAGSRLDELGNFTGLLLWPDARPLAAEALPGARALRGERIEWVELLLRNATTGALAPIALSAGPIRDADGGVVGAVLSFQDITPVRELERLRAEWSSIVAHDLRQPLHMIAVQTSLMLRGLDVQAPDDVRRAIAQIRDSVGRLNRMIGDLMDLSRLEARRLELARVRLDVPSVVHAAVERFAFDTAGRSLEVRVHGAPPPAEIDPDRIAQVMDNLLTNAIKYGRPETVVVVDVEGGEGEVSVAVSNQGSGISRDDLPRLFHRFERTENVKQGRKAGVGGVGLGLYITRGLVEAHGGRITVQSTPGGTTTFRFTLPVG